MDQKLRAHLFISGKVQGVLYRESARKEAKKLDVEGFIRNLSDNRVEAIFEGNKEGVERMVDWARKGPIWAKVESLDLVWEDFQDEFDGFEIRYN